MTLADQINAIYNALPAIPALQAALTDVQTKVDALSAGTPASNPGPIDFSPVLTPLAAMQTTVSDIDAKLTPTPAS